MAQIDEETDVLINDELEPFILDEMGNLCEKLRGTPENAESYVPDDSSESTTEGGNSSVRASAGSFVAANENPDHNYHKQLSQATRLNQLNQLCTPSVSSQENESQRGTRKSNLNHGVWSVNSGTNTDNVERGI